MKTSKTRAQTAYLVGNQLLLPVQHGRKVAKVVELSEYKFLKKQYKEPKQLRSIGDYAFISKHLLVEVSSMGNVIEKENLQQVKGPSGTPLYLSSSGFLYNFLLNKKF